MYTEHARTYEMLMMRRNYQYAVTQELQVTLNVY